MKIECKCGDYIPDTTDYLPYKAHIIGDKDYFDFLDSIDEAIESKKKNRERLCMDVRSAVPSKLAWECSTCGRLYLDDKHGNLVSYLPENGKANRIFDRPSPPPID